MTTLIRGALVAITLPVLAAAPIPFSGHWVGGMTHQGRYTWVKVQVREGQGWLELEGDPGRRVRLEGLQGAGAAVRFEVKGPDGTLRFEGQRRGEALEGKVSQGASAGTFTLLPTTKLGREVLDSVRGLYQVGPDHFVGLEWMLDGIPELAFVDYRSGRTMAVFPEGEDVFFGGSGILVPYPKELRIRILRDELGKPTGLSLQEAGGVVVAARKVALREVPVNFRNGEAALKGTLLLPPGEGPFPAVVLTQTSSSALRDSYRLTANFFVSQAFAALIYDKRGLGASTGDLAHATFPLLADDALAALRALKDRADIHPDHIGMWGASQGGWITQVAAARSKDVAFIIPTSSPSVTPAEQELFRIEQFIRSEGYSEPEVQAALGYQRAYFEYLKTNRGQDALIDHHERIKGEKWSSHVYAMGSGGYWEPTDREFFFFDPKAAQERISCPVLAVYGGKDLFVPVEKSLVLLKERFAKAGNTRLTVQFHPNGSHGLGEVKTGSSAEFPYLRQYSPGFFTGMAEWLAQQAPKRP